MNENDYDPNFESLRTDDRIEEYGRFQQHLVLLEDRVRVSAFMQAIGRKAAGSVVLDVGAGSGVWGIWALLQGAEHAYLVEPSMKMGSYIEHLARINSVHDQITIIPSTLEALRDDAVPGRIDLLVTETLSSCLFGFGSWDALPHWAGRVADPAGVMPLRGTLYAALTDSEMASRGPAAGGLQLLAESGLRCDLFERTFRSGGNIYDKSRYLEAVKRDALKPRPIAGFDFRREDPYWFDGAVLELAGNRPAVGLALAWSVVLSEESEPVVLNSADPRLSSWFPYYVPLREPVGSPTRVRMELSPRDAPYPYAFQFRSDAGPLTQMLYW